MRSLYRRPSLGPIRLTYPIVHNRAPCLIRNLRSPSTWHLQVAQNAPFLHFSRGDTGWIRYSEVVFVALGSPLNGTPTACMYTFVVAVNFFRVSLQCTRGQKSVHLTPPKNFLHEPSYVLIQTSVRLWGWSLLAIELEHSTWASLMIDYTEPASPPALHRPWFRLQLSESEKPLEPRVPWLWWWIETGWARCCIPRMKISRSKAAFTAKRISAVQRSLNPIKSRAQNV